MHQQPHLHLLLLRLPPPWPLLQQLLLLQPVWL
jgi:hypothetical protein